MTSKDRQVVQRIVALDGDCLKAELCTECPFKSKCLPEFLRIPLSKEYRLQNALNALTHDALLSEESPTAVSIA